MPLVKGFEKRDSTWSKGIGMSLSIESAHSRQKLRTKGQVQAILKRKPQFLDKFTTSAPLICLENPPLLSQFFMPSNGIDTKNFGGLSIHSTIRIWDSFIRQSALGPEVLAVDTEPFPKCSSVSDNS